MNEYQKAQALADKYAKANIPLTQAEKNLLAYLKAKHNKQITKSQNTLKSVPNVSGY